MDIDPNNPVVQLCSEGIRAEMAGEVESALRCYTQAWNARRDHYDACIAAHYVARLQRSPAEALHWNQQSLDSAKAVNDDRVQSFYPSLYLNLGKAHEDAGNLEDARQYYQLGAQHLAALQDDSYGNVVRQGIERGLKRVGNIPVGVRGSRLAMSVIKTVALLLCSLFAVTGTSGAEQEEYPLGPDSQRQPGVHPQNRAQAVARFLARWQPRPQPLRRRQHRSRRFHSFEGLRSIAEYRGRKQYGKRSMKQYGKRSITWRQK